MFVSHGKEVEFIFQKRLGIMKNQLTHILLFGGFFILSVSSAFGQKDTQTRSITSADFASQRPAAASAGLTGKNNQATKKTNDKSVNKKRAVYKYIRQDKNIVRRKTIQKKAQSTSNKVEPKKPEKVSEIGITMWKLRPSRLSDNGYKLPVLVNDIRQMWTAERVNAESGFQAGDRVRIAIESSDAGYLYVFDSEIYSDGGFGAPYLIFPTSSGEDNSVRPGLLVDIPDQAEDLPYFVISPKKVNYEGELLTVIISPKPLTGIRTEKDGKIKNLEELINLEINAEAEIYSRTDNQDKIFAQSEADASCGAKTRQLTRENSTESPCGAKTRQLTREEPLPQTIYRVKTIAGQPSVAFVKLNVQF